MEELNNLENMSFSGSPEYIDVFNDGISTAGEEMDPIPNCPNGQINIGCTCAAGNVAIGCTSNPSKDNPPSCICAAGIFEVSPGDTEETTYNINCTCIIKVYSLLGNNTSASVGNTDEGYGHTLKLKYVSGNTSPNSIFTVGSTYTFECRNVRMKSGLGNSSAYDMSAFTYTYSATTKNPDNFYHYSDMICWFNIVSMDGHVLKDNCKLQYFTNVTEKVVGSGPSYFPGYGNYGTISLSAKTYAISYSINSSPSSSDDEKIVKTGIKIGTKFSVYSDSNKTKTATTIENSAYTYSVGYCFSATNYDFKPFERFFINTSAETIYVIQERCGESFGTTISLIPTSGYLPILPPMQTNGKLATLISLYDSSSGLGITSFGRMFNTTVYSGDNKNIVLTPNFYESLSGNTIQYNGQFYYKYQKPTMYYSASTTSKNYCLKINDISTFDKNMYLGKSGNTSSSVNSNSNLAALSIFPTYKNYPLTNVKNGSAWSETEIEKKYFTFYL